MSKHKLIVLTSAVAVAGLTTVSVQTYHQHQYKKQVTERLQQSKVVKAIDTEKQHHILEASQRATLKSQCVAIKQSYDELPAVQKAKVTAPNCDLIKL